MIKFVTLMSGFIFSEVQNIGHIDPIFLRGATIDNQDG